MLSTTRALALACSLALLAGCNLGPAKTTGAAEGVINADRAGKLHVSVNGRSFGLVTADGKAVADLQVQIAGKPYASQGGKLFLPDAALADLKRAGGFVVLVPGYVPRRIGLDGAADIALLPVTPLGTVQVLTSSGDAPGRTVHATLQGLSATFAPNTIAANNTQVGIATYQPGSGGLSLGLQLTVDGGLNPGQLTLSYDLAHMLQGWDGKPPEPWLADPSAWPEDARQRALFAAQVTTAYAALTPAQQQQLTSQYGIALTNGVLTFNVTLGDNAQQDGLARVEVDGLSQLGVTLEVTVLSSLGSSLPPYRGDSPAQTLTPGREQEPVVIPVPLGGGGIPGGADPTVPNIISEHGVGLLGDGGAQLIANNAGNLIGKVKGPTGLLADAGAQAVAKFRLLAYAETAWAGVTVSLERSDGSGYGAAATTDASGAYALNGVPDTAPIAFVHANIGSPTLFALAKMPGAYTPAQASVSADVDAATTAVTCYVKDEMTRGKTLADISMPGYAADVAALTAGMTQAQAAGVATSPVAAVAAFVRSYFAGIGSYPQVLPPPPPPSYSGVYTVAGMGGKFSLPVGLAREADGTMYVVEQGSSQVRKIAPDGTVSLLAGAGGTGFADGPGASARFNEPHGVAVDAAHNVYVADRFNQRIRKIAPDGTVSTLAGSGAVGAADGPAASASFWNPFGVAVDAAGTVYVGDRSNNMVRKIAGGVVTTLASGFTYPESLAVDAAGNVIVADRANHRLKQIAPNGTITTLLGNGAPGFADGPAASARIESPYNVMVDGTGNIFFTCRGASSGQNTIRVLTPAKQVATVAGAPLPAPGASIDGPVATARLNLPWGLAAAADGRIFVTEMSSGSLRVLVP